MARDKTIFFSFASDMQYGMGDRIWWAGNLQFAAGFSEIETLTDQVSGDMFSSVTYLLKPGMQKSKHLN
jgi:hypothetical protein